jgi:hypothetical protein
VIRVAARLVKLVTASIFAILYNGQSKVSAGECFAFLSICPQFPVDHPDRVLWIGVSDERHSALPEHRSDKGP